MSRWFPEHVTLHVTAADSLAVVEGGESLRQRAVELAGLGAEHALDALGLERRTRLSCVFAAELVRYVVLPWNPDVVGAARREGFARHCFRQVYGDVVSGWALQLDAPRYGASTLACAVDTALIDRLAGLARSRGLVLAHLQPSLMAAAHAARRDIRFLTYWLVVQEPRAMTLWLMVHGQTTLVKVLAARESDLGIVLAREWLALGLETGRCPVLLVSPDYPVPQRIDGWNVRVVGAQAAKAQANAEHSSSPRLRSA